MMGKATILVWVSATLWLTGCATSPLGHRQLSLFSHADMTTMGAVAYAKQREQLPEATDQAVVDYVQCVAHDVTAIVEVNKNWHVSVFKTNKVNAWALPGGYIGVYTGLLSYAKNQAQLAAVLGHEVSHVLAHHSNARMSTAYATQAGLQVAEILLGRGGEKQQLALAALGVGANVGILLPYSRGQESEADIMGLKLMARAGFDPREAVQLWHNMASAGATPPEFLSDHPSNDHRIDGLKAHMSTALKLYRKARAAGREPDCRAVP